MKNSNETPGNRTRDLPACSAVPQPTAPPRAPYERDAVDKIAGPARSKTPAAYAVAILRRRTKYVK